MKALGLENTQLCYCFLFYDSLFTLQLSHSLCLCNILQWVTMVRIFVGLGWLWEPGGNSEGGKEFLEIPPTLINWGVYTMLLNPHSSLVYRPFNVSMRTVKSWHTTKWKISGNRLHFVSTVVQLHFIITITENAVMITANYTITDYHNTAIK